jgi:hypothetical protein
VSNQSNDFNTPPELVQPIKEFWGGKIDLDPCSNKGSLVGAETEWTLPCNSLGQPWAIKQPRTTVFVNPPYAPYWLSDLGGCLSPAEYKAVAFNADVKWTRYTIKDWLRHGKDTVHLGVELIYLIPARGAGSSVWQDVIFPYSDAICYLKKRTPFWENGEPCKGPDGKVNPGTFDCALVYFGLEYWRFKKHFSKLGYVLIQDMALPETRMNS